MIKGIDQRLRNDSMITTIIIAIAIESVRVVSCLIWRALCTAITGPPMQSTLTPFISASLSACSNAVTKASLRPVSPIWYKGSMKITIRRKSAVKSLSSYISYSASGLNCSNSRSSGVPILSGSRITTSLTTIPCAEVRLRYTLPTAASTPSCVKVCSNR